MRGVLWYRWIESRRAGSRRRGDPAFPRDGEVSRGRTSAAPQAHDQHQHRGSIARKDERADTDGLFGSRHDLISFPADRKSACDVPWPGARHAECSHSWHFAPLPCRRVEMSLRYTLCDEGWDRRGAVATPRSMRAPSGDNPSAGPLGSGGHRTSLHRLATSS